MESISFNLDDFLKHIGENLSVLDKDHSKTADVSRSRIINSGVYAILGFLGPFILLGTTEGYGWLLSYL